MPAVEYSSKARMRGIENVNIHKKTSSYVDKPGLLTEGGRDLPTSSLVWVNNCIFYHWLFAVHDRSY